MDIELDLHQNIEPMHLHFYPEKGGRKKKDWLETFTFCVARTLKSKPELDTYHIRIK